MTLSLSDFIAPKKAGIEDYIGAFAVTAGLKDDELAKGYEKENDDYNAIMVKSIVDRLAEAFAELMHQRVRKEWRLPDEADVTNTDLVKKRCRGIRPAFGYPACPDHSEKNNSFQFLIYYVLFKMCRISGIRSFSGRSDRCRDA